MRSVARFNVVPAGRRSGKTERAKRKLVRKALIGSDYGNGNYFAAAPTRDQAKRIFWEDLKRFLPAELVTQIRESELTIRLINGSSIVVVGMDKPERMEGSPWDGGILDEYGNMKKEAWGANIRPALSDRNGWCDLIGVPEGRNHYYEIYLKAFEDTSGEWATYTWPSADILDPAEVESAKRDLDPLMFDQEYNASFVNFTGRVYHCFDRNEHCSNEIKYNPNLSIHICFDFNIAPGVAVICQEVPELPHKAKLPGTVVIGQVYIPQGSNTKFVCNKIITDWSHHKGKVYCYGDATGGAGGSAKVDGSDWDIIRRILRPVFQERLLVMVPDANPAERARVNSVNNRFLNAAGEVRAMINSAKAPNLVKDLEGFRCVEGGSGEIDKDSDDALTHISDAFGYYIHYRFPVVTGTKSKDINI
jgi:hypothetical protein